MDENTGNHDINPNYFSYYKKILNEIKNDKIVETRPSVNEDTVLNWLNERLPFFSGFATRLNSTGESLERLADLKRHVGESAKHIDVAAQGFAIGSIINAGIDFIHIPAIYVAALARGQDSPITVKNNAKWLYSAVLLGLGIASMAAATAVLPLLAAAAVVAVSAFSLGYYIYDRRQLIKTLEKTNEDIHNAEKLLEDQKTNRKDLSVKLRDLNASENPESENPKRVFSEIDTFLVTYNNNKSNLQALYNKKAQLEETLIKMKTAERDKNGKFSLQKGYGNVVDKTARLIFVSVALAGTILSVALFASPIGPAILLASAAGGLAYVVGRVITSALRKRAQAKAEMKAAEVSEAVANQENQINDEIVKSSDAQILGALCSGNGNEAQRQELREAAGENELEKQIPKSVQNTEITGSPEAVNKEPDDDDGDRAAPH